MIFHKHKSAALLVPSLLLIIITTSTCSVAAHTNTSSTTTTTSTALSSIIGFIHPKFRSGKTKQPLSLSFLFRKRNKNNNSNNNNDNMTTTPKPSSSSSSDDPNVQLDLSKLVYGSNDVLFNCIEQSQRTSAPLGPSFGRFLDSGTGSHSLRWMASLVRNHYNNNNDDDDGLTITNYTAVTADESMRRNVVKEAKSLGIEEHGDVIIGNWEQAKHHAQQQTKTTTTITTNTHELCQDEIYDTILADYLVGAMDGFSPYFQDQIFPTLSKHLKKGGRLYVVGLNPIPDNVDDDGDVFCRVTKLRDACILLAGHRCYREYPPDWIERHLTQAGLKVIETKKFPIMYTHNTILRQLNVARSKLSLFPSKDLAREMGKAIDALEHESRVVIGKAPGGRIKLGFDYVVTAEKPLD